MKLAIVHDDLIQHGGAESLLLTMHEIWPKAPVFTSSASKEWLEICEKEKINLRTSFIQKIPFAQKLYKQLFPLYPIAFEQFDFSDFDVVLSSSTRFSHMIKTKPETVHICYMNSPGRMFWETEKYFGKGILKRLLSLPLSYVRLADYVSSQKVDYFIANSKTPQARIKKYYGRESKVIYPFVDFEKFSEVVPQSQDYFVTLTRLVSWKKIEIAIEACKKLNLKLKIIGDGKDLKRLKKISGNSPFIEFLGYISTEEKKKVLAGASALIVTQKEDFGISAVEAMACGVPVVAYAAGGSLEIVVQGKTGEFFNEQTATSLEQILKSFDSKKFNPQDCKDQAKKFSKEKFVKELKEFVVLKSS